jgi:hypothetical protein
MIRRPSPIQNTRRPFAIQGRLLAGCGVLPVVEPAQAEREPLPLHPHDDMPDAAPSGPPRLQRRQFGSGRRLGEDPIDLPNACAVLQLEEDLVAFRRALQHCRAELHSQLWTTVVRRLWSKVVLMSESRELPAVPYGLAHEVASIDVPRQGAVRILAQAQATGSGDSQNIRLIAQRLELNAVRFLETPEGRGRRERLPA